jgi:tetratricopeptide (TPR) repeat protein
MRRRAAPEGRGPAGAIEPDAIPCELCFQRDARHKVEWAILDALRSAMVISSSRGSTHTSPMDGRGPMYLSGSKWNMRKKRRPSNPWRILLLLLLIGGVIYLERVIVPTIPKPFVPTEVPTRSPASFLLEARSLFEAGKLAQASAAYEQAITADPNEPTYYIELARLNVWSGEYDRAEENARNALLIDPESPQANATLGWILDFQGDMAGAEEHILRALNLDPNSALAHAYYAEIIMDTSLGNYEQALDEARSAVALDPDLLEGHRALGYVWEWTGNYDQAIDAYSTALVINPNIPPLYLRLGNMYLARGFEGDVELATENYIKAIAKDPTDVRPYQLLAQANARVGEYGKASQYAREAMQQDPSNPYLHGDLGRMYYKNGQIEEAVNSLGVAIRGGQVDVQGEMVNVPGLELDPGDGRVVEFYYFYGLALANSGNCSQARQIAQSLLVGVRDDEIAVANAEEVLNICGVLSPSPTPEITATPES